MPREVNDDSEAPVSLTRRSPMLDAIDRIDMQEKEGRKEPRRPRKEKEAGDDWKYAGDRDEISRPGFIDDEEEEEKPKKSGAGSLVATIISVLLIILFGIAVVAVINNFDELTRWLAKPTIPEFFRPWDQPSSGTSTPQGQQTQPAGSSGNTGTTPTTQTTQKGDTTPPTISDLSINSVTEYGATITWKTSEPSMSKVIYKTETGQPQNHDVAGKPVTSHRVVLTQLDSGKTYFITVKSWDDSGNVAPLQEKSFQTLSVVDTTPPKLMGQPEVATGDSSLTISWKTDEKAISQLRYGLGTSYEFSSSLTEKADTDHSIFISSLSPGTTYHFQLISTDASGNVMRSADYLFTTDVNTGAAPYMGSQAPGFKLKTLDGGVVTLSQFRGKKVIMNFWASWCSPCKVELPHLQAFWEKYQNNNDVALLTVAGSDSDLNVLKSIVSSSGYKFIVALDENDDVFNRYEIISIPKTYFIDRGGVIRRIQQGMFTSLGEVEYILTSY
jgi:peroxiredoxin